MIRRNFLFPFLLLPLGLAAAPSHPGPALEHVRTLDGIEEYVLPVNGLSVLLMPMDGLPVATVMVTYEVGSRNEATGTTGATHILEHMMFKGTEHFRTENGTDYSSQMERIGARSNATTWFDRTNYFATLPSDAVPLAIEIEADRMRNLLIRDDDLASEMTVVRNEYERGENDPVRTLIKELYAAAFVAHPYGHPTIGWRSDIENTSAEKLRSFYDTYYWPENACLTIIGGFDKAATMEAIESFYGAIPPAPDPIPTLETEEPEQPGPRRVVVERAGQLGVVATAYKVPAGTHGDWPALAVLEQILGANKTGRLYRALEDTGRATATFSYAPMLRDPSLFMIGAYLSPDSGHTEVEALLRAELKTLAAEGVSEDELARAKSVLHAATLYGRDGPYAIASPINEAIAMGDWTSYVEFPKAVQAVTAEAVREVARKYFNERQSTTGWYVPTEPAVTMAALPPAGIQWYRDPATGEKATAAPAATVDFSRTLKEASVGPIRVVTVALPVDGIVSFTGSIAAGDRLSPPENPALAGLTAAMLDKGTASKSRFAIAEELEALGAGMSFSTDTHELAFSGKFLSEDADVVLALLAGQLREPAFDAEVFESVRQRTLGALMQSGDETYYRANNAALRLIYPEGHPNYPAPLDDLITAVEGTTVQDLQAFHDTHYGPESMILVFAGDVDPEAIEAAVRKVFDGWSGGGDYAVAAPGPLPADKKVERVQMADKTSVDIRFVQATGLQRTDDDYLPFMVGNYILGGSAESRLPREVREERGLTYHIRSFHRGDILTPGYWTAGGSFAPALLEDGLAATRGVLEEWHREGVTREEVKAAITTLGGSYLVGLSTSAAVAGQLHSFLIRGFEASYIDAYPGELKGITAEAVNRTIRTYFNPEKLALALAGTLPVTAAAEAPQREIEVRLDAPDPAWTVAIQSVHRTEKSLVVVSALERTGDMAAQVITTVSDRVSVADASGLPVRHYVTGKSWSWGEYPGYEFVDSTEALEATLERSETLYRAGQ